jgi:hypothetical protein
MFSGAFFVQRVVNHIAGCLKSALAGKSTVELYCDLEGLQATGGGSIPADAMVQAKRPAHNNEGWDCSLYMIKVGTRDHILKTVKDRLRLLFWAWVPAGHKSGIGQKMKDVSRISLLVRFLYSRRAMTLSGLFRVLSPNA